MRTTGHTETLKTGDRVTGLRSGDYGVSGVVVLVENIRGRVLPVITVLLDSGQTRRTSVARWQKQTRR